MHIKDFSASIKAAGSDEGVGDGQVRMLVSVFNNVDVYGDVVTPGAFANSLNAWKAKGDPIPFIWAHQWSDPFSHIGYVTEAKETDAGLEVTAQLDLTMATSKQVFGLLKGRRVTQASFGYEVLDSEWVEREAPDGAKYEVRELREVNIFECGPCLVGANQETELLEAKARDLAKGIRAGRQIPKGSIDALTKAVEAIGDALNEQASDTESETVDDESTDNETATAGQLVDREADDSPDGSQVEESSAQSPSSKSAQARARLLLNTIPTEGDRG